MLVLNFLFFLPNSMILSTFMLGNKRRAVLNLELKGLNFLLYVPWMPRNSKKRSGNSIGGHPVCQYGCP